MKKPSPAKPVIELNDQFRHAVELMEHTSRSLFITGRAGTGKSTLLTYFLTMTRKKVAVLAPTGVAALNVKGQTIHSFFRFRPSITIDQIEKLRFSDDRGNIYKQLDAIIIDEISMVRADLLDCIDRFLRLNGPHSTSPFGGIQMLFIGDLYQLPPVITGTERKIFQTLYSTPYFYSARAFDDFEMELLELEKVYRQRDAQFLDLLNAIRNNAVTEEGLTLLNQRLRPDFEPPEGDFYLYLTTTNASADHINRLELDKLPGHLYTLDGIIEGEFDIKQLPTALTLQVKAGAQIMMLNNDPDGRWVNGSIGKIEELVVDSEGEIVIIAELTDGEVVEISPYTWEISRLYADEGQLQSEVVGTFTQYPLMLAWAVTIHKSQGKTFERVIIDIGKGTFASGQVYVALSRCTTLEGIILKKPILKKHVRTDYKVMEFLTRYQYQKSEIRIPLEQKMQRIQEVIDNEGMLQIVYLKPNDEKTTRIIRPETIGEMNYRGKSYLGVRAYCMKRQGERVFRVDRILEMVPVAENDT